MKKPLYLLLLLPLTGLLIWSSVALIRSTFGVPRRHKSFQPPPLLPLSSGATALRQRLPFNVGDLALFSTQGKVIRTMLQWTIRACDIAGARCMLDGGTLLGQFRHDGDLIPFDEDADVIVLFDDLARLRSAWDAGDIARALDPEFAARFKLIFTDFMHFMPRDIVARAMDTHTGMYLDVFMLFEANLVDGRCPNSHSVPAPRPARSLYFLWPSDTGAIKKFSQALAQGDKEDQAFDCEVLHGVFSNAWWGCHRCEVRPEIDRRRRAHIPVALLYPLRRCSMVGLDTYCPRDVEGYLHYLYGPDLSVPFDNSVRGKSFHVILIVFASLTASSLVRSWKRGTSSKSHRRGSDRTRYGSGLYQKSDRRADKTLHTV